MTNGANADPNGASPSLADGLALIEACVAAGVEARLLGGIAVALRCPSARPPEPLARTYSDIDLVTVRGHARSVKAVLYELGHEPAERFNAANGDQRLLFYAPTGHHIDVFLNDFRLCHVLPLRDRLAIDERTVSLADLLLTKLQVAKLSHKDVTDVTALLADHDLSKDEDGINIGYIARLLAQDWGWWRTVTETLDRLSALVNEMAPDGAKDQIPRQLLAIRRRIDEEPKSLRWRTRARIGERHMWRDDPEDT